MNQCPHANRLECLMLVEEDGECFKLDKIRTRHSWPKHYIDPCDCMRNLAHTLYGEIYCIVRVHLSYKLFEEAPNE